MDILLIKVLLINLLATLVRSTFGFGEALVAVPLLGLLLPLNIAVPLSVLLSVAIALLVVIQDHRKIDVGSAKGLVLAAIIGVPLGLLILIYGNEKLIKMFLGLVLIIYSIWGMINKSAISNELKNDKKWLWVCGIISGVLGGAYGINGPPLVIYGQLKGWSPKEFRATLQGYFLPVSLITVVGYFFKDLITSEVIGYFLKSIPVMIPGIYLGRWLNHRIKIDRFFFYVHIGLVAIGIIAIFDAILSINDS
ncbi:sulfite exporter TauE/SafE family protein [Flavitalea sp.]|nr:sulfite exporter TauE/SafE family protein [Flavitalea sp.]